MAKESYEGRPLNTPKVKSVLSELVQKIKKQPVTQKMPGLIDLVPEIADLSKEEINKLSLKLNKTLDRAWAKSAQARGQLEECLSGASDDQKKSKIIQKKEEKLENCSEKAFWINHLVFVELNQLYKKAMPYKEGGAVLNVIDLETERNRRRIGQQLEKKKSA